jgi:hypothetical protein
VLTIPLSLRLRRQTGWTSILLRPAAGKHGRARLEKIVAAKLILDANSVPVILSGNSLSLPG